MCLLFCDLCQIVIELSFHIGDLAAFICSPRLDLINAQGPDNCDAHSLKHLPAVCKSIESAM